MNDAYNHEFKVRVITEDGELVMEDTDFHVNARWDWFETVVNTSKRDEVVQLIDTDSDSIVCEQIVGAS